MLAQHVYGYKPVPTRSSGTVEIETDRENAASLAKALYTAMGIPFTICCIIYSFLYCTYPRDRDRARMEALRELELGQTGSNAPCFGDGYYDLKIVESGGLNGEERSMVDYGEEESLEFDHENDEKALLAHRQLTFTNMGE
ncbi:hypothetical protein CRG98_018411 [Punica granatum]|nr:hypothetical protein CRG98_018411 [Punica granatum]